MEELDEQVQHAVVDALRDSGAVFAFIHGSPARGTARAGSDIDVAAWWASDAPPSFDVLLPPRVDLLVLNDAPLELAGRVAVEGVLLFDDDPPSRVRWVARRARSTSTSCPGSSAVIESLPRAFAVVDETRVLRLLRADDQIVLARLNDPSDLEQFSG